MITNVGPVHVELLGTVEAIAAAKAEIIDGLAEGGTAVVPADPGPLEPHLERAPRLLRFGRGGDVQAREVVAEAGETSAVVVTPAGEHAFKLPFVEAYNLDNALGRDRRRGRAGAAGGGDGTAGAGDSLLAPSGGESSSSRGTRS